MMKMAEMLLQEWEINYEDLGNVYGRVKIQSCNTCVFTSMALCVWPCNCYKKGSWMKRPEVENGNVCKVEYGRCLGEL